MFVRLTFIKFAPESLKDAKRVYMNDVVPVVRKQKGNINIHLLEPSVLSDDFISLTEWETQADADTYGKSGVYKQLVDRLSGYFTKAPLLKSYAVEDVLITSR